ncbi:short-chain dehydrogenase [Paenibacillus sp. D9]|uniref:SDR family oxidoreductase n=1 Tax=Paenibacillus TaxID=44249 RepID=UPI00061E4F24|nr:MULTISPECIES: SDR family oxidoreductase [Paenibacillus]KKC48262.1 short-chain dehydrogenase [Paenibacillus sp. D9]
MKQGDRIALVTGASSGFGLLTSVELARRGFKVIATMRNPGKSGTLLAEAERAAVQDRLETIRLDVTEPAAIREAVADVMRRHGRIDVLVNNAGYAAGGFVEEVPMAAWREQMETNVFGLIAVTQAVLPHMRGQGCGHIVNISSVSGLIALPGYAPYSTSKFAVEGFSEALRLEMKPFGIDVSLVEPGAYRTEIWKKGFHAVHVSDASPYRGMLDRILAYSRKTSDNAPDPAAVARLVASIAGTAKPRMRYLSGRGMRLSVWGRALLPWRWYEALLLRMLK